jgi:hypothetical protein
MDCVFGGSKRAKNTKQIMKRGRKHATNKKPMDRQQEARSPRKSC